MSGKFAASTSVSVAASKAEIERIVERYGAGQFMSAWSQDKAIIAFVMEERQVRFTLEMPDKTERRFTHHSRGARTPEAALKEWEQACRQKWRALAEKVGPEFSLIDRRCRCRLTPGCDGWNRFDFKAGVFRPMSTPEGREAEISRDRSGKA